MTNHPNRSTSSRTVLATLNTYRDITSAWVEADLRADDTLRVTYRSRWQGTTDGRSVIYRHTGLAAQVAALDPEQDADALIESFLARAAEIGNEGHTLRRGWTVR